MTWGTLGKLVFPCFLFQTFWQEKMKNARFTARRNRDSERICAFGADVACGNAHALAPFLFGDVDTAGLLL